MRSGAIVPISASRRASEYPICKVSARNSAVSRDAQSSALQRLTGSKLPYAQARYSRHQTGASKRLRLRCNVS